MHNHSHSHSKISHSETGNLMRLASLASLIVGLFLVIIKTIAWYMSDSLSLMSSLADSMLDVMASTVNFVAIRYALKPADDDHRFGHGKAEDLATFAQSTFICGSGVFLIFEGIKRMFSPEVIHNSSIGIIVMIISIIMSIALVSYQKYVVSKTDSSAIEADSMHYVVDIVTNSGVIIALILNNYMGLAVFDPIIAIMIAIYIIYGSWKMGYGAFHNLMDREFSNNEYIEIEQVIKEYPEIHGIHELRTRKSGIYRFIQFHLDFIDENISLKQAHIISDSIEEKLKNIFPNTEILIHQDPLHGDS
ncbi:MAG: cation diffusion facilitator family transporter [Pseudomonadota bacterium]